MAMKRSSYLSSLSLKLLAKKPAASSAAVVPWPPAQTIFHQWLAPKLEALHAHSNTATTWLSDALRLAAEAQTKALLLIQSIPSPRSIDRQAIEAYLDDNDLFDAIEGVRLRIEAIRRKSALFSTAIHRLECGTNALDRARSELSPLTDEEIHPEKCSWSPRHAGDEAMLDGSRAVAGFVVAAVWAALWPRKRKGAPAGMKELKEAMEAAERVRRLATEGKGRFLHGEQMKAAVEELRRSKTELEERVVDLEEKVEELYRKLVSVRVFLLGVISFEA